MLPGGCRRRPVCHMLIVLEHLGTWRKMVTVISGVVVIKTLLECLDERPPQVEKIFGPAHCCR